MKVDWFKKEDELGFFFKKKEIKSNEDKEIICDLISVLFHAQCCTYSPTINELDKIIQNSKKAEVGILVHGTDEPTECGHEHIINIIMCERKRVKTNE